MSPTKHTSGPLTERSPNTSPSKTNTADKTASNNDLLKMPATAAFPIRNDQTTSYISPSDAMMSPTSKKLSAIKGRKMAGSKQLNGRELFAKARALKTQSSTAASSQTDTDADSSNSQRSEQDS
ncbi:uncharacterized protein AB675_9839 [Cyphellophora attinorum]|uniref:Uncharacterized protein n=1 Tax=Cyphellophora attinorum TaxID=1664694 RepID=A0A0N0NP75_9EURO|nr:uncharacterized protein AB675_9839 [Phialophora attinorum]KPI42398.1 hypothetical protein AB675_9839 [Phialophora attinorum]